MSMNNSIFFKCISGTFAFAIATGTALAPTAALATEAANDNIIWTASLDNTDMAIYQGQSGSVSSWNTHEKIDTVGDNDYHIMSCGGSQVVTSVSIGLTHSGGDLDIRVYKLDGTYYGSSASTTNFESVNVSSRGQHAVVMRVYGYNNATNPYAYSLGINCS